MKQLIAIGVCFAFASIVFKLYVDLVVYPTRIRSFALQTLSYFSRPTNNEEIMHAPFPIANSAAWYPEALKRNESLYRVEVSKPSYNDLVQATKRAFRAFPTRELLRTMEKKDFVLANSTIKEIEAWRMRLHPSTNGTGFLVVSNMPVFVENGDGDEFLNEVLFFGLGFYFGIPGAQNSKGELLGNILDTGIKNNEKSASEKVRQYMTNEKLDFHCDAADLVALLTLRNNAQGGESRVVSSVTVYNELLKQLGSSDDSIVRELFQTQILDTRDGKGTGFNFLQVTPLAYDKKNNLLRSFFHCEYMRTAYPYDNSPKLRTEVKQAIDLYCALADKFAFDMVLKKGDLQLVNNHYCLHGRNSYEESAIGSERKLLRLWISLMQDRIEVSGAWNLLKIAGSYVRQRAYFALF